MAVLPHMVPHQKRHDTFCLLIQSLLWCLHPISIVLAHSCLVKHVSVAHSQFAQSLYKFRGGQKA